MYTRFRAVFAVCLVFAVVFSTPTLAASPDSSASFDPGTSSFSVQFGDRVITHRIMAVTVMPGASVNISVQADSKSDYRLEAPEGTIVSLEKGAWRFTAPEQSGLHTLEVINPATEASVRLQAFVLTPWAHQGETLDGYRIGTYRERALRGLETYERPGGFIQVTEENKDALVSPHFRLEQFLCKQTDQSPQFMLVRTRLLERLERILAGVNEMGHRVSTLNIMSGYRTPYYNRSIGNTTEYSRHLYGDAADIFVDANGDNEMDDLNGDGRVTEADARLLAKLVDDKASAERDQFPGGMGIYGPASHRGPFVHVDLRGYQARW